MTSGQCLATASLAGLEALSVFNKPVFEAYEELSALVRQKRGRAVAQVFARPQRADTTLTWMTDLSGPTRRWIDLSHTERMELDIERQRIGEALTDLVVELTRSGPNTQCGVGSSWSKTSFCRG